MLTPKIRQWLYTASAIASALIPLLVTYKVLDPSSGSAWINLVGILGALGGTGAATAAVMTARQRKDGTLDFSGSPAQQAIEAFQATVSQAATAATDLDKVKSVVTELLLGTVPALDQLISKGSSDPASADYQP